MSFVPLSINSLRVKAGSAPATSDAIEVENARWMPNVSALEVNTASKGSMGHSPGANAMRYAILEFDMPSRVTGTPSAGASGGFPVTQDKEEAVWEACGFTATHNGTGILYSLSADPNGSGTELYVHFNVGGVLHAMDACRGTIIEDLVSAQLGYARVRLIGKLTVAAGAANESSPSVASYLSTKARLVCGGGTFSIGGYDCAANTAVRSLQIDYGNSLEVQPDWAGYANGGYGNVIIGNRAPKATVNVRCQSMSDKNWWTDFMTNNPAKVTISAINGSVADNKRTYTLTAQPFGPATPTPNAGVLDVTLPFLLVETNGGANDQATILET